MDDFNMNEKYLILQYTHIHNAGIAGFFLFALTYTDSSTSIVSDFFLHHLHKNNYRGSISCNTDQTGKINATFMHCPSNHIHSHEHGCVLQTSTSSVSPSQSFSPVQVLDLRLTPPPQL